MMAGEVETKAVELMDKAAGAVEAFAAKLQVLGEQYGPDVVDAALAVARVDALSHLLHIGSLVAIVIGLAWGITKLWPWAQRVDPKVEFVMPYAIPVVMGIAASVLSVIAAFELADPWPWIGVFEPKLWIAKTVLGL